MEVPKTRELYEGPPLGLCAAAGAERATFTQEVVFEPPCFYVWVEVGASGGNLVVELADNPPGISHTFHITSNNFYPLEVRKVLSTTSVNKVTPLYPRGFRA